MKISYLLPTVKPSYCAQTQIDIIKSYASHDYEIIFVGQDTEYKDNKDVVFVYDHQRIGSVNAFNLAFKHSTGDLIVIVTDDDIMPANFLDILDVVKLPEIQSLKVKVGNLVHSFGGPGLCGWRKRDQVQTDELWPLEQVVPPTVNNRKPYSVAAIPLLFREDINKYLDGIIFNTMFKHHYCDHWLGYYTDQLNNKIIEWPKNIWTTCNEKYNSMKSPSWDFYDRNVFLNLVNNYNPEMSYNYQLPPI